MAAFSTSFWLIATGVAAVAAGVAYVTEPPLDLRSASASQSLAAFEQQLPKLADVPSRDEGAHVASDGATFALPAAGAFVFDHSGALLVTPSTIKVLDGWAAATIGKPADVVEGQLRASLSRTAGDRAWALLRAYLAYRQEERATLEPLQGRVPESELLRRTMALRQRHFDAVSIRELFGNAEARSLYASEVARILADATLTDTQQLNLLRELRLSLPPEVADKEFGGSSLSLAMEREVAQMRARGLDDAEIVHFRRQYVDVPGAKSVVEVEREKLAEQRAVWQQQHSAFIRERDQVYSSNLEPQAQQNRLDELLRAYFKSDEVDTARKLADIS